MTAQPPGQMQTAPEVLEESEINLRELFDVAWSGKHVVLLVTLACVLLATAYAFLATPWYQADGLVQVEETENKLSASMDQLSALIGGGATQAPAEIALLKSRMVLGSVVERLKLDIVAEPDYFPLIGEALARGRETLVKHPPHVFGATHYAWGGERIRVTSLNVPGRWYDEPLMLVAEGEGYALFDDDGNKLLTGTMGKRASATTPYGEFSIFVQDLVAHPGTRFDLMRRSMQKVLEDLDEQLTVAEQARDSGVIRIKLLAKDPQLAATLVNDIEQVYLQQNVERRSAQAEQSLEFLKLQLPEIRAKVDEAQANLNRYQLRKGTADVQRETELVLKLAVDLDTKRLELIQERDAALKRYTNEHPIIIALNEQIRGLEREQEEMKKKVATLPETQQEVLSLMRDVEVNQQLYTALLNSAQELQITKGGTIGNVRIVDPGLPPLEHSRPKRLMIIGVSIIVGLFLGLVTVFAMRALLRGVDRPEEIERALGLPTYASIPFTRKQRRLLRDRATAHSLLAAHDKDDAAIESLRSLRTALHFAMMEADNNVVMITGPIPGIGKSFVTINFGGVLALAGRRVVVIDADLRRGELHKYVGTQGGTGLSDYVAGEGAADSVIHHTPIHGLDFIGGGTRPPNPAELLMHPRFADLLKTLSEQYDYVLIDTAPILPVTDAAIVARLAGTSLLVLKSAEHPMRAIEESARRLQRAGARLSGVIFNQVGARVGSYGYGSYGRTRGYSASQYQTR